MNLLPERIQRFIEPEPNTGCWLWIGQGKTYGWVDWEGRTQLAHRVVYRLLVGSIMKPQLDHICRTPLCVNPAHLRPVTARENTLASGSTALAAINARKTHCPRGHVLVSISAGRRGCRECSRARCREYHHTHPEQAHARYRRNYLRRKNAGNRATA